MAFGSQTGPSGMRRRSRVKSHILTTSIPRNARWSAQLTKCGTVRYRFSRNPNAIRRKAGNILSNQFCGGYRAGLCLGLHWSRRKCLVSTYPLINGSYGNPCNSACLFDGFLALRFDPWTNTHNSIVPRLSHALVGFRIRMVNTV